MFVNWAVGGSKARPPTNIPEAKGIGVGLFGANFKILPPPKSPANRLPSLSNTSDRGEAVTVVKVDRAPVGVNLRMLPVVSSATKRLPAPSNASPWGLFKPAANGLWTPPGVNLTIDPVPAVVPAIETKRLPLRSNAR